MVGHFEDASRPAGNMVPRLQMRNRRREALSRKTHIRKLTDDSETLSQARIATIDDAGIKSPWIA